MSVRRTLLVAFSAVVLAGPLVGEAAAKKKPRMSMVFNGKKLKSTKSSIVGIYSSVGFSVGGSTKPRGHGPTSGFAINCPLIDLRAAVLPATITDCAAGVTQTFPGGPAVSRTWASFGTIETTVKSYDGSRVTGTFQGTIDPKTNPSDGAGTVAKGRFSVVLTEKGS